MIQKLLLFTPLTPTLILLLKRWFYWPQPLGLFVNNITWMKAFYVCLLCLSNSFMYIKHICYDHFVCMSTMTILVIVPKICFLLIVSGFYSYTWIASCHVPLSANEEVYLLSSFCEVSTVNHYVIIWSDTCSCELYPLFSKETCTSWGMYIVNNLEWYMLMWTISFI